MTIARTIVNRVHQTFDAEAALFLPDEEGNGQLKPYAQSFDSAISVGEAAVAAWAFDNRRSAGHGTDALSDAEGLYLPLQSTGGMLGVIGIWLPKQLTVEQRRLLDAFVDLAALAVERIQLVEAGEEA
jgi:two-component system sensor histidine kinase KdpD